VTRDQQWREGLKVFPTGRRPETLKKERDGNGAVSPEADRNDTPQLYDTLTLTPMCNRQVERLHAHLLSPRHQDLGLGMLHL